MAWMGRQISHWLCTLGQYCSKVRDSKAMQQKKGTNKDYILLSIQMHAESRKTSCCHIRTWTGLLTVINVRVPVNLITMIYKMVPELHSLSLESDDLELSQDDHSLLCNYHSSTDVLELLLSTTVVLYSCVWVRWVYIYLHQWVSVYVECQYKN